MILSDETKVELTQKPPKVSYRVLSEALAELILTACEESKTGEISERNLTKIIFKYLTKTLQDE